MKPAPETFERRREAELFLSQVQADRARGRWIDPDAGKVKLATFGREWIDHHPDLAETTYERYDSAFRLQIAPHIGDLMINEIDLKTVRQWRSKLLKDGVGVPSVAKAYRLLRAMLNQAVEDEMITKNPCRIKGASDDKSPERPTLALPEVYAVVMQMPARFRPMVLLATFTTLRLGELAALRRRDLDLDGGWVHVVRGQVELSSGRLVVKAPKSEAGTRDVGIPSELVPLLAEHVDKFAEPGRDGRVFVGEKGGYIRRQNFRRLWTRALERADVTPVHFHDLRHTGNTLAAENGANLRELMRRMGHSSPRAALIYLHAKKERERVIADSLNVHIDLAALAEPPAIN